jgi:hypothetical protein
MTKPRKSQRRTPTPAPDVNITLTSVEASDLVEAINTELDSIRRILAGAPPSYDPTRWLDKRERLWAIKDRLPSQPEAEA